MAMPVDKEWDTQQTRVKLGFDYILPMQSKHKHYSHFNTLHY